MNYHEFLSVNNIMVISFLCSFCIHKGQFNFAFIIGCIYPFLVGEITHFYLILTSITPQ